MARCSGIPVYDDKLWGELSAIIIADSLGFVKQKFAKLEGIFLDGLYQDMIRHLKEEVWLWRIIAFVLAAAVIIALFL